MKIGHFREQTWLREHQRNMGVLKHVSQAVFWVSGIERHARSARLEHREQSDGKFQGTTQADPNPRFGSDTALPKKMR